MLDIDNQEKPKRPRGRPKGSKNKRKPDGRRNNSGQKGNPGNRTPRGWKPAGKVIVDRVTGEERLQTEEEAWADAKALVRHMAAIGYPVDVMGRFLQPVIRDDDTVRKHFAWELENGRYQADMQVAGVAFRMATNGRDGGMTRWWMERRVKGFEPNVNLNHSGTIKVQTIPGDETL